MLVVCCSSARIAALFTQIERRPMRTLHSGLHVAAFLTVVANTSLPLAAQCEAFANAGWYNTREIQTSRERAWTIVQRLHSDQSATYQSASNLTASVSVPLEGVLIGLGFGNSEEGFAGFRALSLTELRERFASRDLARVLERTVSPDVARLIEACFSQPGVHAFVESHPGANVFTVAVKYNGIGRMIANVQVDPERAGSCDGILRFQLEAAQSQRLRCRTNGQEVTHVTVNTNTPLVTGGTLWLVPPAPPPARAACSATGRANQAFLTKARPLRICSQRFELRLLRAWADDTPGRNDYICHFELTNLRTQERVEGTAVYPPPGSGRPSQAWVTGDQLGLGVRLTIQVDGPRSSGGDCYIEYSLERT
jgi:hypothetical protein